MNGWFETLAQMPPGELRRVFEAGGGPDVQTLPGYEFRGFNVGAAPRMLGIQKFIKGFVREDAGVYGYNRRARQNGLDGPWEPRPSARPFGFFTVAQLASGSPDASRAPAGALFLDYGASLRNPRLRVERLIRDYLVVPDPAAPDVLLGRAHLAVGTWRPRVAYFVLERLHPIG